jgi:hypothetical protein
MCSGLDSPLRSHQRIEVVIQVNRDRGGMEDSVQLHEGLLQSSPLSLINGAGTPRKLLIPAKETSVLRSLLNDIVR